MEFHLSREETSIMLGLDVCIVILAAAVSVASGFKYSPHICVIGTTHGPRPRTSGLVLAMSAQGPLKRLQNIARSKGMTTMPSIPTTVPGAGDTAAPGSASAVAGAVLGGLLLGPLGAVIGSGLAANANANANANSNSNGSSTRNIATAAAAAAAAELVHMGISRETVGAIAGITRELQGVEAAQQAATDQLEQAARRRRELVAREATEYAAAKEAVGGGDETKVWCARVCSCAGMLMCYSPP